MATDNASYFSNVAPGEGFFFDGNKYRLDSSPKYPLGFRVALADGSTYRYCQFGAATNRGVLVSQDVSEVNIPDTDNGIIASASSSDVTYGTAGSRKIEITMAGIIANQFAGGYLVTTDDTGEGYTYRIKGNTATGSGGAVATTYVLELHDPLQEALGTTTDYSISALPWNNVEVATRATDSIVCGVTCATTTAAKPFAFVQTKGVCGVLQDANVPAIGDPMALSVLTAGAATVAFGGSIGSVASTVLITSGLIIGYCVDPGDSTGHSVIALNLPW